MTPEAPELRALAARLDAIRDRLENLRVQVRGLVMAQIVEAQEFVVGDERGEIRARFEMHEHVLRLTFYDRLGKDRLRIGLRKDGAPSIQVRGREIPLEDV